MISRKHQKTVFSFFMALFMSCIMSFVITLFNIGFVPNLLSVWLKSWSFAFVIAFPAIFILAPIVHKIVSFVLDDETPNPYFLFSSQNSHRQETYS